IFLDSYSIRTFNQDYPDFSHIVVTYKSGSTTFISRYNIISLGHYPTNVIMTQNNSKDGRQYWIPNDYIVETEFGKRKLHSEIKYTSYQKEINYSEPQSSGPRVFGLDIGKLHQCRLEALAIPTVSKRRPLSVIQTKSG
ncbi:14432_t:CDS:2, partial [Funneliformis caledonium]